ncbi:universal stress protein [Streptacidiphilus sp. 4-A2]|nr:universal stress protein [Streptacidiphilus sp. 4-A2]
MTHPVMDPVVVGVDDAPGVDETVDWAADEAQLRGVRLHLVHAWLGQPYDPRRDRQRPQQASGGTADPQARRPRRRAAARAGGHQGGGGGRAPGRADVPQRDVRAAGGRPPGRRRLPRPAGRVDRPLPGRLRRLPSGGGPARPGGAERPEGVVGGIALGLRGREAGEGLLDFAFDAAQRRGLPLRVLHAWRTPLLEHGRGMPPVYEEGHVAAERERLVAEIMAGWRQRYPDVPVHVEVVRTGAAKHLVEWSATEQLLVVGRYGNGDGPVRRLGSVSQAAVHYARCPVAVVPAD